MSDMTHPVSACRKGIQRQAFKGGLAAQHHAAMPTVRHGLRQRHWHALRTSGKSVGKVQRQ